MEMFTSDKRSKAEKKLHKKLKDIYKSQYTYEKLIYSRHPNRLLVVTCRIHGDFRSTTTKLLSGEGCPFCQQQKAYNKEFAQFMGSMIQLFGEKYDFSEVEYIDRFSTVTVRCPKHGEFKRHVYDLKRGIGCPKCDGVSKRIAPTTEIVKERIDTIYEGKYDTSEIEYTDSRAKIKLTCPEHGVFYKRSKDLMKGMACPRCVKRKTHYRVKNQDEYISAFKRVHGEYYDTSTIEYIGLKQKVRIICPVHGEFEKKAGKMLYGAQCPKCHMESRRVNPEEYMERVIHNPKLQQYDFTKSVYVDSRTLVTVTCPIHGDFTKRPDELELGRGCPECLKEKHSK